VRPIPPRSLRGLVLAPVAAALLAGCGGSNGPHLARADVAPLINLSHRIASEGACAQARDIHALQRSALRLVNERRVPRDLQETFLSGVNELVAQTPACVPVVPLTVIPSRGRGNNHGNKGHGKHGEHGD
jgi:hypothetical protein